MRHHQTRGRPWLEALFDAHYARLLTFAARRVGPNEAEDVVSEVFAAAWRRRTDVPEPALPWLYQTARNVVMHTQRSDGRRAGLFESAAAVGEPSSPSAETSSMAVVDSVLAGLEPTDAEVLRLTVWEELTPAEISQVLGVKPGAIRVRLLRARQRAQDLYHQTQLAPTSVGDSHA